MEHAPCNKKSITIKGIEWDRCLDRNRSTKRLPCQLCGLDALTVYLINMACERRLLEAPDLV
jgi:hypothetical protein